MNGRMVRVLGVAVLAWLCLVAVAAAQSVGELVVERGQVKLRRASVERVYRPADGAVALQAGDVLQSARETRAKLTFAEGDQTVSLFASTVFTVKEVAPRGSFFQMALGKAFFAVQKLLGNKRFEVDTPTATIGVKGTEFVLGTDGANKSYLLTVSGVVGMRSLDFPEVEVDVGANQASFARKGERPTPPVEVPPEVQDRILGEEGLDTMEGVSAEAPPPAAPEGGDQQEEDEGDTTETESETTTEDVSEAISDVQQTVEDTIETVTAPPTSNPFLRLGRGARDIRITR